jgi:signal transduction histidine kinase
MATVSPPTPGPLAARHRAPALIYLIDDDPLVLSSLGRLLELETPHEVRRFSVSADALTAMRDEAPDLIVSDLTMPGMDGLQLLARARAIRPDAARIVLTGYADKESAVKAINEAGIYQYIEKPWDNTQLLVTIDNALEHASLQRQLRATVEELRARNVELEDTIRNLSDAQDRLIAAERLAAVGRLASGIAHEIGNQLSLLGYAELLAERYASDPEAKEMTDPLLAARRRLAAMVASIKDFVRGKGDVNYRRHVQPLAPIFDEATSILRFEPSLKARNLVREPDDRTVAASVNSEKLMQVFLNLLRNSIQATREGGMIRVGVWREGAKAIVTVTDDGTGIEPKHLQRIWEPFFSTKGEAGTGLGLGICRRIVEEHGGTIEVESKPGEGAKFTIELPAA